jgi:maltooligosyltrehalose trehalohydrolase
VRALPLGRPVHLILENDHNQARWLPRGYGAPERYTAQWNDDLHHCWHVLLTGETDGYYSDYAQNPAALLARALAQGFAYQGDASRMRKGEPRGEPSSHVHPGAFVDFLQNHDQIGNRAFGERIDTLAPPERVALARSILLLCPHTPMLFMGEEWAARGPFHYFVGFEDEELSSAVRHGRRREFAHFAAFSPQALEALPDPTDVATFEASRLDRAEAMKARHADALAQTRTLLALRQDHVAPLLASAFLGASIASAGEPVIDIEWRFAAGRLRAAFNVGSQSAWCAIAPDAQTIFCTGSPSPDGAGVTLPPWAGIVLRERADA